MCTKSCVLIAYLLTPGLLLAGPTIGFTEVTSSNLVINISKPGIVGDVYKPWTITELDVLSFKNTSGQTFTDFHIFIYSPTENLINKTYTLNSKPFFTKKRAFKNTLTPNAVTLDFWCGTGIENGKVFRIDVASMPSDCQFTLTATVEQCECIPAPGSLLLASVGLGFLCIFRQNRSLLLHHRTCVIISE